MTEYCKLIQYMGNPKTSAKELLQFKLANATPYASSEPLLQSKQLAEQLREYKIGIERNRRNGHNTWIKKGDIHDVILENFGHLYKDTKFIPMPDRGCRRVNIPFASFAGPNPGYQGHQIPKKLENK